MSEETSLLAGKTVRGPESARIWIDDRPYINFAGCSYLALQTLDELRDAGREAVELGHPWSQMRSSAYGGGDPVFDSVETEGAKYFGCETSVFMPTGYFCGPAAVAALGDAIDVIYIDELAHFSLYDAAKLSGKPTVRFSHCSSESLEELIRTHQPEGHCPLILTDGVFATMGRVPPLAQYQEIASKNRGILFVDESHAYGVIGENGRGAAEHCGASQALHAGTLGKGFCSQGAIFPCSQDLAERVRKLPPVRGAGAGSPVSAMVATAALRFAAENPQRRRHLSSVSQRLKIGLRNLGLNVVDTPAPITSFVAGNRSEMLSLQLELFKFGVHVILSNYIGSGSEGVIRCATYADHSEDDIDTLIEAIRLRI